MRAGVCWGGGLLLVALGASPAVAAAAPDRELRDPRIVESSGLATSIRHPGVLWTHNDSGDRAQVFAVGRDGRTIAVYGLGTSASDWEGMAAGRNSAGVPRLWVGDIGDNGGRRGEIVVHRVEEPSNLRDGSLKPVSYRFTYPDGPRDAEALLVHPRTGRIYIVSKRREGGRVYRAPARLTAGARHRLEDVGRAPATVTDGVFLADGRVVLRDYTRVYVRSSAEGRAEWQRVAVDPAIRDALRQAESMAASADGRSVLIGSEGDRSPVFRLQVPGGPPARPSESASSSASASAAASPPVRPSPLASVTATRQPLAPDSVLPPLAEAEVRREDGEGRVPPLLVATLLVAVAATAVAIQIVRRRGESGRRH